jgi:hypothetical protein
MDKGGPRLSANRKEQKALLALLKQLRVDAGLRQVDMARKLGKPQAFVSYYESGRGGWMCWSFGRFAESWGFHSVNSCRGSRRVSGRWEHHSFQQPTVHASSQPRDERRRLRLELLDFPPKLPHRILVLVAPPMPSLRQQFGTNLRLIRHQRKLPQADWENARPQGGQFLHLGG